MSHRNPVIYLINDTEYKLEYLVDHQQFNIDTVTYPDSPEVSFKLRVSHRITVPLNSGHQENIRTVIGYLAFRQDSKAWYAYDSGWNYVLEQPKLLLSFAQLCEIAHHDLPREPWE